MTFYRQGGWCAGRDPNVDEVMRSWEQRYCSYQDSEICISSFNVNGRSPPSFLPAWFPENRNCDVYAIGLQEMDLSVGTYIKENPKKAEEWVECIRSSLPGGRNAYKVVAEARLVGIFLVICIRTSGKVTVGARSKNVVPTGISVLLNKLGNKGGAAVSLKLNDTWICFVNSHFAAGNNELERRNQDFRDISQMTFDNAKTIYDHDIIFWFGDLNYRLNNESAGLSGDKVREIASSSDFGRLLNYCQLKEQMNLGQVFSGFVEATNINFRPTYKYDVGSHMWDTSEKGRVPAWTDRILYWKADDSIRLDCLGFASVSEITISDHRPVKGLFKVALKTVDERKANALYEEACREADRKANDLLPHIELSLNEIDFGEVRYLEPTTKLVTVRNTGLSQVKFSFKTQEINKHKRGISASWLQVTPPHSVVPTGHAVQLSLTISIDTKVLRDLQGKSYDLQDILVLHLESGRDFFLPVSAKYNGRVFGSSIPKMLSNKAKKEVNLIDFGDDDGALDEDLCPKGLPKEIHRLLCALQLRGAARLNLSEQLDNAEFIRVRNALESGEPRDLSNFTSSFILYSSLMRLLDTLEDAIIPQGMDGIIHYEFIANARNPQALWRIVETTLEPHSRVVLESIVGYLHELISQKPASRSELQAWAEVLFRVSTQPASLSGAPDPRIEPLLTLCEYRKDAIMY